MKIVYAASEVAPFCKTGGLGDVAGALPQALAGRGHEVVVVTPLYQVVDRVRWGIRDTGLSAGGARLFEKELAPGCRLVLLDRPEFFDRPALYGEHGGDYPDNAARFAFYGRAILPAAEAVGMGSPDVLHLNDWQPALAAWDLARMRGHRPGFARCVATIHNLGYQGLYPKSVMEELGLPWELFTPEALEFHDQVCFLKGALAFADRIATVSPTYAREIQQPEMGFGLDAYLRFRSDVVQGILNAVDTTEWNPATDTHLAARYTADNIWGKAVCRRALCKELFLEERPRSLILGIITRFAGQKGMDLVLEALPELLKRPVQLAVLGSGETRIEEAFDAARIAHPGTVGVRLGFANGLAHRIEAGADAFLMPSVYEPCGLNQMYSMIYGTPPIVRNVGGLADTVEEEGPGRGTGFIIGEPTVASLVAAVDRALACREDPARWVALLRRGMNRDFSWDASAAAYERLYASATGG